MPKSKLTLGSLFDGSGRFPLGGLMCGIKPMWASEIEPFAIRVTTKRLHFMKHLGDINAVNGSQIDPVDIITFGSPCQDMSIAGKILFESEGLSGYFVESFRVWQRTAESSGDSTEESVTVCIRDAQNFMKNTQTCACNIFKIVVLMC